MRPRTVCLALVTCLLALAGNHRLANAQAPTAQQPAAQKADNGQQLVALADQVAVEVEKLRGWTFKQPVKKALTTVEETVKYLRQQVDESLPPARAQVSQAFLRTIGLLPPDADVRSLWLTLLENQVGGFYDTKTKSMHLVARAGMPPVFERVVLAHELTHALDDQYADLDTFTRERTFATEDVGLVAQSVVEGSATGLMMQYMARAMVSGKIDMKQVQEYAQQEQERSKPFLDAPRYFSAMLGSYICGTQFLAKGQMMALLMAPDNKAIGEALLAARKDPPQSTEQILHPQKYWNATERDEPVLFDDRAAAKWLEQPGRFVVHTDTVGELLTAILTSASGVKPNMMDMQAADAWTNTAASGWGGDRFYLLASDTSADTARRSLKIVKGVWMTAWDTAKDRDEFVASVPRGSVAPGAAVAPVGQLLALVYFGFDQAECAELTRRLTDLPLPMTKAGKSWSGANIP